MLIKLLSFVLLMNAACGKVSAKYIEEYEPYDGALLEKATCGEATAPRIISGEISQLSEYPWIAAMEYVDKSSGNERAVKCSGSVITDRYILTAASCLSPNLPNYKLTTIILGEWQLSTDPDCITLRDFSDCNEPVQKFGIEREIPHPEYFMHCLEHDIALLRVDKRIRYSGYVIPICLRSTVIPNPQISDSLDIAGWGVFENGTTTDVQLRTTVYLQPRDLCQAKLSKNITADQLCAVGDDWKGSCKGNYGGPLMRVYTDLVAREVRWYQEGVATWGPKCGIYHNPIVYTNVANYRDWIVNTVS